MSGTFSMITARGRASRTISRNGPPEVAALVVGFAQPVLDEVAHPGAPGLGERLTRRPTGEDVDPLLAQDRARPRSTRPDRRDPSRPTSRRSGGRGSRAPRCRGRHRTRPASRPARGRGSCRRRRRRDRRRAADGPLRLGAAAPGPTSPAGRCSDPRAGETQGPATRETCGGRVRFSHRADSRTSHRQRQPSRAAGHAELLDASPQRRSSSPAGRRRRGVQGDVRLGGPQPPASSRITSDRATGRPAAPHATARPGVRRRFAGYLPATAAP